MCLESFWVVFIAWRLYFAHHVVSKTPIDFVPHLSGANTLVDSVRPAQVDPPLGELCSVASSPVCWVYD
jgi:hypothetical protein